LGKDKRPLAPAARAQNRVKNRSEILPIARWPQSKQSPENQARFTDRQSLIRDRELDGEVYETNGAELWAGSDQLIAQPCRCLMFDV